MKGCNLTPSLACATHISWRHFCAHSCARGLPGFLGIFPCSVSQNRSWNPLESSSEHVTKRYVMQLQTEERSQLQSTRWRNSVCCLLMMKICLLQVSYTVCSSSSCKSTKKKFSEAMLFLEHKYAATLTLQHHHHTFYHYVNTKTFKDVWKEKIDSTASWGIICFPSFEWNRQMEAQSERVKPLPFPASRQRSALWCRWQPLMRISMAVECGCRLSSLKFTC